MSFDASTRLGSSASESSEERKEPPPSQIKKFKWIICWKEPVTKYRAIYCSADHIICRFWVENYQ